MPAPVGMDGLLPRAALLLALLAGVLAGAAPVQAQSEVRVTRNGSLLTIHGGFYLPVRVGIAWGVLTDYNRFAEFVPDVTWSRVASVPGEPLLLDLRGENGVLFFRIAYRALLRVDEEAGSRIGFRSVGGNFIELSGEWRLTPEPGGVRIVYRARMIPEFWVPPLIGPAIVRHNVRTQLDGLAQEMLRRESPARPGS